MSDQKKLAYRDVPRALWYVVRVLWRLSPAYVLLTIFTNLKDRLVPFVTLFISAAAASKLPALVRGDATLWDVLQLVLFAAVIELASRAVDLATRHTITRKEAIVTLGIRHDFYHAFARLPYHMYEEKSVIDSSQYADSFMYNFGEFGVARVSRAISSLVEFVAASIALLAVAWYLPLLLLASVPFLLRSLSKLNRLEARAFFRDRPEQRRVWAIEALFYPRKIKETRLYGAVEYLLQQRNHLARNLKNRELAMSAQRDRLSFGQQALMRSIELIASAVALVRIAYHGAPIGVFILAQQLTSRASSAVESLFQELTSFDKDLYGFAEYKYITETLQPKEDHKITQAIINPSLVIRGLDFAYQHTDVLALRNVTIDIPFGSTVAIVGENGAGKTTLTRLLLGLYLPSAGQILLNGEPLDAYGEQARLSKMGVLLQDFGLDEDITIRDAVWLGNVSKPRDDKLIWKALADADMEGHVRSLGHQLDSYLGKWIEEDKGVELSGGQLQRLAIARALFRAPDILLLDEPTASIDANAEERIFETLMEVRKGQTTIFISHRFSTVRRAQRIIFMHEGRVAESGTHQELMRLKGKYYQMFTAQSKGYQ